MTVYGVWCVCRYVSKCVLFPPCIDGFSGVQCSVLNWWNLERREWSNPHPFMATFVESYFSHFTFCSFWWAEQTNSWYIPISLAEKVFSPSLHLLFSPHHFTLLRSLQRANPKWRREVKCCLRTINKLWFKFYVKTIYWTASKSLNFTSELKLSSSNPSVEWSLKFKIKLSN